MWNCPYCQQQITLTWKRYFTEPGSRKKCPRCGKSSQLNGATSIKLWTIRICGNLLGAIPLAIVGFRFGELPGILGLAIGGLTTGLPIDKCCDEKYRQLLQISDEK
jgi:hypothetical protein